MNYEWFTCIIPSTISKQNIVSWLTKYSKQWIYQLEHSGIRILYYGLTYHPQWNTIITKQDEANKFMMIKNHPTRIEGPYQSDEEIYLGEDLYHFIDEPQPWQQEFLDIINAGIPGLWYMQWYNIGKWEKYLDWMNFAEYHPFRSTSSLKKSLRYSAPHRILLIHLFEASTNRKRLLAIKLAHEIASGQITYRNHTVQFDPKTIVFLCSERPCPRPHEGITFMTISDDGQHLIPATDYETQFAPKRPGL
jgi:hypothetical protein